MTRRSGYLPQVQGAGFESGRPLRQKSCQAPACSFPAAVPRAACGQHWRMCKAPLPRTETWSLCSAIMGVSQPCCAHRRGTLLLSTDDRTEQITEMLSFINHVAEERGEENREHTQITTQQTALQEVFGDNVNKTPPPRIK